MTSGTARTSTGSPLTPWTRWTRRVRRGVVLAAVLAVAVVALPPATPRNAPVSLVKVDRAHAVGHKRDVIWILALGSDARPGQSTTRERADAIQLVGVNTRTGAATAIGVPRDSYVTVPGHGRNKINASMMYGGPQLMARSVGNLVGIRPDYVVTAGFDGFRAMVRAIGGVTVHSRFAFSDPVKPGGYHVGKNRLNAFQTLIFARIRKKLPRGDFDRSADQQAVLRGILRKVRARQDKPGFMEHALLAVSRSLDTDLRPSELFVLAQALTGIEPSKMRGCVINGSTGYVGSASVVFPDVGEARSIAARVRRDATLTGGC